MSRTRTSALVRLLAGASIATLGLGASAAMAQDADASTDVGADDDNVIIVSGIRASLADAMNIKRDAVGVVDAISAEDIGKFPDTNLAESLQRITGVSIDRASGEGSKVTVRGFGPDYNLVLLNGRQMPASGLGDCCSAPASRSFDFANLASEGVAGVEVYKSGRATLPTGGIGSTINIKTPRPFDRPGFQGSIGVKGVLDHTFEGTEITPEVSGIVSQTFADDTIGILISGSWQKRRASLAQFGAGFREGYLGTTQNWGSLPPEGPNVENRPGPTDIYNTPQNAGYDFIDFNRKRINGQAVLQFRPTDTLTATLDYTYSKYNLDARTNSIGVWFNHGATTSSWTDGPAAGPNFYSEAFCEPNVGTCGNGKDLAITGAVANNQNVNRSLGFNIAFEGDSGWRWALDAHHSTATSRPDSPYGSNIAVGSAIFGVKNQTVDFTTDMPTIIANMYPGSEIDASNIRPAGNAFRNAFMRDRINEVNLHGGKDFEDGPITSLDFGVDYIDNKVRSAYGFLQTDSWGGTLSAADTPDDFYTITPLPPRIEGMEGPGSNVIPNYFDINTEGLINFLNDELGICETPWSGTPSGEGCLAVQDTDRRLREKTVAPYLQATKTFNLLAGDAHIRGGLRYEVTDIKSSALVRIPVGAAIVSDNEITLLYADQRDFTKQTGSYKNWLPAVDFDFSPIDNVVLRASYSHTITRPDYASLNGGLDYASPARPGGGSTGASGNPDLIPYKSKNIDLSAEWYYGSDSYLSVGYFHKDVSNYIANTVTQRTNPALTNPGQGVFYQEAAAALGANASFANILSYVAANHPDAIYFTRDAQTGQLRPTGILGQANDPDLVFNFSTPYNSDQTAAIDGFEFAIQHSFWNTGFGVILNYTMVDSNTEYDNTAVYTTSQFAVTGVSDSANAVLFYDKNGFQARVAYNWRDKFLAGYGFDPSYVEAYGQVDASASYDFAGGFSIFAEGINLTNADRRVVGRNSQTVLYAGPGYARYAAGVRYKF